MTWFVQFCRDVRLFWRYRLLMRRMDVEMAALMEEMKDELKEDDDA